MLCYFRGSKGPSDAGPRHRASAEESQRPVHPHEHVYLSGSKNSARGSARGPGGGRPGGLGARAPGGIRSHGCPKRHGGPGSSSYLRRNVGACSAPRIPKTPKLHVRAHEKTRHLEIHCREAHDHTKESMHDPRHARRARRRQHRALRHVRAPWPRRRAVSLQAGHHGMQKRRSKAKGAMSRPARPAAGWTQYRS